jgi:tRNA 2-thiouridine synthesizing protein E
MSTNGPEKEDVMAESMQDVLNPGAVRRDPAFPHAPADGTPDVARHVAADEGIDLTEEHWELVRALQEFFHRHEDAGRISVRELHDALDEHFHSRGGRRHLYELMPGGPVAQGCRLAGLQPPAEAANQSFGSVS